MKTSYVIGIGVGAAVFAVLLVITIAVAGFQTASPMSTSTGGATFSTTGSSPTSSTSGASSTSGGGTSSGYGDFAMMATDPPVAASGVSSATVNYDGMAVHGAGSASASGWTQIQGTGTINLMSSENVSQTIGDAQVQSGTYDMVALNVTSGSVVYNGQTYAAAIASGNLNIHLNNDVQVNSSASGAAIVDLRTFVINSANTSNPEFVITASAKATAVPASDVTTASLQVGAKTSLNGQAWWTGFQDQTATKIDITSSTMTSNSLSLQVSNTGNSSGMVQTVVITPMSASSTTTTTLPASLTGSAVFTVGSGNSVQESNTLQGAVLLNSTGTSVSANSSTTLTFDGTISLNFGLGVLQLPGVVAGQTYLITVMGANTFGNIVVVAQ